MLLRAIAASPFQFEFFRDLIAAPANPFQAGGPGSSKYTNEMPKWMTFHNLKSPGCALALSRRKIAVSGPFSRSLFDSDSHRAISRLYCRVQYHVRREL